MCFFFCVCAYRNIQQERTQFDETAIAPTYASPKKRSQIVPTPLAKVLQQSANNNNNMQSNNNNNLTLDTMISQKNSPSHITAGGNSGATTGLNVSNYDDSTQNENNNNNNNNKIGKEISMSDIPKDPVRFWNYILKNNGGSGTKINLSVNSGIRDPVHPLGKPLRQIVVIKVINSNAKPLLLDLMCENGRGGMGSAELYKSSTIILKAGDDLRKDCAVMQVFRFMNRFVAPCVSLCVCVCVNSYVCMCYVFF